MQKVLSSFVKMVRNGDVRGVGCKRASEGMLKDTPPEKSLPVWYELSIFTVDRSPGGMVVV